MNRAEILQQFRFNPEISVLIIGGGINGIGVFRDLALNGVGVLLIDRNDFCSGASSASSHMAHGGIRYLENGEFRLVREAVRERNRLIKNAPHIVRPLPTIIPIFKLFSGLFNAPLKFFDLLDRPAERGALVIKLGLMLYDSFTYSQNTVPPHHFAGRKESLENHPQLNPDIRYTATYYDGQILSPERLAIELLLDAEAEGPHARALNYMSIAETKGNTVILHNNLQPSTFNIDPKIIINATGPWIDSVNATLGISSHYISGTKGSHLVLDHTELRTAISTNEFFFENSDGRIVLIFPFYDKVIIGTSDIPIENADEARCTDEEIDYFITLVARVFPGIKVSRENIVFRFSGVRPLAYRPAKTAGQITRDHTIQENRIGKIPVYSLVGGKWTTHRAFAEQVTDRVLAALGRERIANTRQLPIGGGRDHPLDEAAQAAFIQKIGQQSGLPDNHSQQLFERYGTRALDVAQFIQADRPIDSGTSSQAVFHGEIRFLVEREKAVHIDDVLLRRTNLAWLGETTPALVADIANPMGNIWGWTDAQKKSEVQRAFDILRDRHGIVFGAEG